MEIKEEDIQEAIKDLLKYMKKIDEFIFDPSYRIIYSMNDMNAMDDMDDEDDCCLCTHS